MFFQTLRLMRHKLSKAEATRKRRGEMRATQSSLPNTPGSPSADTHSVTNANDQLAEAERLLGSM